MNDYQKQALDSVAITERSIAALAHRALGLSGEAGEVANCVKKIVRDRSGQPTADDIKFLKEKLGDTMYYLAVLSDYLGLSMSEVANANLGKSVEFKKKRVKPSGSSQN